MKSSQNNFHTSPSPGPGKQQLRVDPERRSGKKALIASLATGLVFLFNASGRASELPAAEIPFRLHDHLIVVQGSIGSLENQNLVIDTGTSTTSVSPDVGRKLRLRGEKKEVLAYSSRIQVHSVTLSSLVMGPLLFQEVPANVLEAPLGSLRRSLRIDALIGLDLLKRTNLSIDFESQTLRFGPIVHSEDRVPFYRGLPFVDLRFEAEGEPLHLQLDTAAPDIILFAHRVEGRVRMKESWERKEIVSYDGSTLLEKVYIPELTMGADSWEDVEAFLMRAYPPDIGLDGILGPEALGLKQLHIDFQNGLISWERGQSPQPRN